MEITSADPAHPDCALFVTPVRPPTWNQASSVPNYGYPVVASTLGGQPLPSRGHWRGRVRANRSLLTGYLIVRSTFLPRMLGVLAMLGGLGWMSFLYLPLGFRLFPFVAALGLLGAASLIVWLLVFGVDEQRWMEQAGAVAKSN